MVLLFLFLVVEETTPALGGIPLKEKISRVDIPGTVVFVPSMVCLLLALQWGGQTYAWGSGRIVALLVVFGVLLIVFVVIQIWRQEAATVPPRIAKQRTIASGAFYSFCLGAAFLLLVYYLSIWFQAIKGDSAITSGYSTLPFILSMVIASILSGVFVSRVGYYNPVIIAGGLIVPIGAGLFTLFTPHTAHPMWIGVQFLFGFGVGLGMQQTNIAAQTVLDKKDAPTGVSLVFFAQGIGGTISVSIGQNVLGNELIKRLSHIGGLSPHDVVNTGATELRNVFSKEQLPAVLEAYNKAIVMVFYCALAFACAAILGAIPMEWKTVKKPKPAAKDVEKQEAKQDDVQSERQEESRPGSTSTPAEKQMAHGEGQQVTGSKADEN